MKKIIAILALLLVQNSYALELKGINGVEILAINGKEVKNAFFSNDGSQLSAGEHQIVVRYASSLNTDELLESRPDIFTLNLTEDTQISAANMNNLKQIERELKKGVTWVVESESKEYEVKDSDTLQGQGFMPYSDIEKLVANYNQQKNITLANGEAPVATAVATTAVATQIPHVIGENTLISVYQQASKEQKKTFRLWLLEQDMK